jgi:hypothetical protein
MHLGPSLPHFWQRNYEKQCCVLNGKIGRGHAQAKNNPKVTRVNSANVLDKELRIRGKGRQMNSKVKDQTNYAKRDAW